jgi:hypothetical protein
MKMLRHQAAPTKKYKWASYKYLNAKVVYLNFATKWGGEFVGLPDYPGLPCLS